MKKRSTKHILFIFLLLLVVGCSSAQIQTQPPATHLKVQVVAQLSFAPYYIAQQAGYFAEQGLEVEFVSFRRSAEALPALLQGDLDVVGGGVSLGFLNTIAQDENVKFVADKGNEAADNCPYSATLVRNDLVPQIKGLGDLKGKIFMINKANYEAYQFENMVAQDGLTLDDISIVDIPSASIIDAFNTKSIDFAVTSEPWVTRILDSEVAQIWLATKDKYPGFQTGVMLFGPNLLTKDRQAGVRFITAYLKAVRQYRQGKTENNIQTLAQATELESDFLKRACWPDIRIDGSINTQSILDFENWAIGEGLIDQVVPAERFWDPSFTEAANQKLGSP